MRHLVNKDLKLFECTIVLVLSLVLFSSCRLQQTTGTKGSSAETSNTEAVVTAAEPTAPVQTEITVPDAPEPTAVNAVWDALELPARAVFPGNGTVYVEQELVEDPGITVGKELLGWYALDGASVQVITPQNVSFTVQAMGSNVTGTVFYVSNSGSLACSGMGHDTKSDLFWRAIPVQGNTDLIQLYFWTSAQDGYSVQTLHCADGSVTELAGSAVLPGMPTDDAKLSSDGSAALVFFGGKDGYLVSTEENAVLSLKELTESEPDVADFDGQGALWMAERSSDGNFAHIWVRDPQTGLCSEVWQAREAKVFAALPSADGCLLLTTDGAYRAQSSKADAPALLAALPLSNRMRFSLNTGRSMLLFWDPDNDNPSVLNLRTGEVTFFCSPVPAAERDPIFCWLSDDTILCLPEEGAQRGWLLRYGQ